jgi:hypothetical protein
LVLLPRHLDEGPRPVEVGPIEREAALGGSAAIA